MDKGTSNIHNTHDGLAPLLRAVAKDIWQRDVRYLNFSFIQESLIMLSSLLFAFLFFSSTTRLNLSNLHSFQISISYC